MRRLIQGITALYCAFSLTVLSFTAYTSHSLPDEFYVRTGEGLYIDENIVTYLKVEPEAVSQVETPVENYNEDFNDAATVSLKMFGIIPIKDVDITYIDNVEVVPCGTAFGIKMFTDGVVVVGTGDVDTQAGPVNPAARAGIKVGDVILSINGQKVSTNEQVAAIIDASHGEEMIFSIKRKNLSFDLGLIPEMSAYDQKFKGGMWVRDSSAGIGTMTYYNPESGIFGGLGHPICDVETGEILPLMSGEIVEVDITGVNKGINGVPGELRGSFSTDGATGVLLINSETGVFGTLSTNPTRHESVPLALRQEIAVGEATILCTLDGGEPAEYAVVIESVDMSGSNPTKNMVIRIVDRQLLDSTGGIVQGMSGSPILQNGKLVGAVTHVFVNDPTKGYGIFAENMLKTAVQLENSGLASSQIE